MMIVRLRVETKRPPTSLVRSVSSLAKIEDNYPHVNCTLLVNNKLSEMGPCTLFEPGAAVVIIYRRADDEFGVE